MDNLRASAAALILAIASLPGLAAGQSLVADSLLYLGQRPPGRRAEVFAPGVISVGRAVRGSIAFMPDGTEIYWVLQDGRQEKARAS